MASIKELATKEKESSLRKLGVRYGTNSARQLLATHAIRQRYEQLGGIFSPLGLFINEELDAREQIATVPLPQGGYQSQFRGGNITIHDFDNLAIEEITEKVKIWFVGIECLIKQESEDEIFGTIGVVLPSKPTFTHAVHFPTGSEYLKLGVEGARMLELNVLVYDDVPADVVLTCNLIEHDSGDISEYKRRIAESLSKAAEAGLGSVGVPAEAVAANQGWIGALTIGLVNVLSGWLGADDDAYLPRGFRIPAKDILIALRLQSKKIKDVPFPFNDMIAERPDMPGLKLHYNLPPIILSGTDQGGDLGRYALYFKVEPYTIGIKQ